MILQGTVWYLENVYIKDTTCFNTGYHGDYGLPHACICAESNKRTTPRTTPRDPRLEKRLQREQARWGKRGTHKAAPGTGTKPAAKTANYPDREAADATCYKLDYVHLMVGSMTQFDKHGNVKYRGTMQVVEDL